MIAAALTPAGRQTGRRNARSWMNRPICPDQSSPRRPGPPPASDRFPTGADLQVVKERLGHGAAVVIRTAAQDGPHTSS